MTTPIDISPETIAFWVSELRHLGKETECVHWSHNDLLAAKMEALRLQLTASEKRIEEAAEIIEEGCSSGNIPGCDADTKWQERRTAWLAKGETK